MPQSSNFSKDRHRLPEDGPNGPKHVRSKCRNVLIVNVINYTFNKGAFVGKENCDVIGMHGVTRKLNKFI
jgi:hypothetical protein